MIRRLTVEERSVVYIEFINHYKPKHSISVWKTDPAGKVIPTGASFELYLADDFDDTTQKPKENAEVIASGTTGENGILSLGKLAEGEYRLLETKAPAGYILPESAIKITITETQVSAMLGSSNLQINVKRDGDWVEEVQADDTHQIRVWKYDMTLNRNEVIRFTNLPTGTKYRIQEIYANHYKADNSADSAGHATIEKVSNISEEGYEISEPLTTNGTVEKTAVNNDTISGTITTPNVRYYNQFTNILTAVKAKIKILKTSQTGITPLPGAIFDLYTREGYESTPKKTLQTDLVSSAETGKEGIIDLGKLGDGVYYLVEISAPKGYIPLQDPVIITVSSGEVTYSQENSSLDDSGDGKTGDFHVGYQLKVTNDAGVSLSATGGPGTSLIYLLGMMLTGIAVTGLVMRNRRRNAA